VKPRICVVIADHRHDDYLTDVVGSLRAFVPAADIAVYNSGDAQCLRRHTVYGSVTVLPTSRPLNYAKVTPFFLDMFEWAAGQDYDYILNAETDMAWIKPGFETFLADAMQGYDYMASGFTRDTPRSSRWRPYRSLRPEVPELLALLGLTGTSQCFSPAQVFSSRYIDTVVASPLYPQLCAFVMRNQAAEKSFTLQEVLLPTLVDTFSLSARDYPPHLATANRYRPYHAAHSVRRVLDIPDAYFVHPIRRDDTDPARIAVRQLITENRMVGAGAAT
jgi:hypothetical protein